MSFTSCEEDFLEKSDPGAGAVDGFFQTADDFKLGVNGIYNSLTAAGYFTNFWGGNYFHMNMEFDVVSDNMVGQGAAWKGYSELASGLATPLSGGITDWKFNYGLGAISKVNTMLAVMADVDFGAEGSAKWEAELKYLRGFLYADMAFLYGGMPLITESITSEEADALARSSQAQTYEQAISDLTFAAANLGDTPNAGEFGRPTKMAAQAALGFAYLNQKDYASAKSAFSNIISQEGGLTGLASAAEWECLNRGCAEQNKEIIWSIQNGPGAEGTGDYIPMGIPTQSGFNGWSGHKFTQNLIDAYGMANGLPITDPDSGYDPANPLKNRDPRLRMTFYFEGDPYDGGVIDDGEFGGVCCNGSTKLMANIGIAPVFPRKYTADPDLTPEAFAQMNGIEFGSPIDLVIYRYADILLAHAEALNESGDTAGAYAGVNKVRNRAGLPDLAAGLSKAAMKDAILQERRVELALEGKRYYDLKRAGILMETVNSNKGWDLHGGANYKAHYDLWPLPGGFVDNSPAIEQNPGY
tara:strand:- start:162862 stop:164439 length:1578 start_codon:yes stop_codon:yes gene_type:complete